MVTIARPINRHRVVEFVSASVSSGHTRLRRQSLAAAPLLPPLSPVNITLPHVLDMSWHRSHNCATMSLDISGHR